MKNAYGHQKIVRHWSILSFTAISCFVVLAALMSACGGGTSTSTSSSSTNTGTTSATKTSVQINMGDSPADWMLAFSMNLGSMSLTGNNGSATAVSSSVPMEMLHLMGTLQPITMISVPQGSYTGASITISSATVMYMDPTSKSAVQKTISGPMNATVTFSSPVSVGATPMAMDFDLDLANSVAVDSSGNMTMNPVFHVTTGMQGTGTASDPANGGIQQMMGAISGVSGSSFTMTSMQAAQTFTFMTNSSTEFDNITGMSMMTSGMLVAVDATMQSDGSLMATKVQSMMGSGGVMGGGIITAVTGQPATQLTMVMQNGAGTGMMSSYFAAGATINLNGSTVYQVDKDNVDMSSLSFTPVFDGSHIYTGQSVMPISSSGMTGGGSGMMGGTMMSGTIAASQLELEQQGISGTTSAAITSSTRTSFTLTLPTGAAFNTLTGATSVTIYQQPGTTITGASSIASGSSIHAFGLLFYDSGQWKMVASRIGAN